MSNVDCQCNINHLEWLHLVHIFASIIMVIVSSLGTAEKWLLAIIAVSNIPGIINQYVKGVYKEACRYRQVSIIYAITLSVKNMLSLAYLLSNNDSDTVWKPVLLVVSYMILPVFVFAIIINTRLLREPENPEGQE